MFSISSLIFAPGADSVWAQTQTSEQSSTTGSVESSAEKQAPPVELLDETEPVDESNSAQEDSPLTEETGVSLESIVSKTLEAYGGAGALARLEDQYSAVGRLLPAGAKSASYSYRKFKKGEKWRVDLETPVNQAGPSKSILAFNGLAGWRSAGSAIHDLNAVRLAQLNDDNERQPSLLSSWGRDDYVFKLAGSTTFAGVPVYAVDVKPGSKSSTTILIDKRNFLVAGIKYLTAAADGQAARRISVEYSQYKPVSGTMFPFKQSKYINGKMASQLTITNLSAEAPIDDLLFDRPQSVDKVHLSRTIEVPFDYNHREILVKGRLNNGEELVFLFDTGASSTIIDRRVAAEHYLLKGGRSNMLTAGGSIGVESAKIDRLELGKLIVNGINARVHSLAPQSKQLGFRIAGIIGTDVIRKFVVKIDYGKPELVFYDSDNFQRPKTAAIVPLVQHNAPVVKMKSDLGQEVLMLADTGAAFNNLPQSVAQALLKKTGAPSTHITEGTGLDGKKIKLGNVVLKKVSLGTQSVSDVNFTYTIDDSPPAKTPDPKAASNLAQEKEGFFHSTKLGILGNPFWQNFTVTVDYKFQRLLLEPNPIVRVRTQIEKAVSAADDRLVIYRDFRQAESGYQKALLLATNAKDMRSEAILWGRLANMRRMMAKDLGRPEHARTAYEYFVKAQELARKSGARDVEGHVLADWSLLYGDNGQQFEAKHTINRAIMMAPQDPQVNVDYAVHLYRESQFAQMQRYIEKALFLEPANWQALWYQFKLSERFFDMPKAVATLKEILRYYPWSKLAQNKLAEYKARMDAASGVRPPGATNSGAPVQKPNAIRP